MKRTQTLFLVILAGTCLAQDATLNKELSLAAGTAWSDLRSPNARNDPYASAQGGISPYLGIDYCWLLGKHTGLSTGIHLAQYRNVTKYQGYFKSETLATDPFGYEYYPLSVPNYSITRTVNSLDVPVCFRLSTNNERAFVLFAEAGARLNLLLQDKAVKDGEFSHKGLYPTNLSSVFILVENEPIYGFLTVYYREMRLEGRNKFGMGAMLNLGAIADIGKRHFLSVTLNAYRGLTNMSPRQQEYYSDALDRRTKLEPTRMVMVVMRAAYGFRVY